MATHISSISPLLFLAALVLATSGGSAGTDDEGSWPQWRGPARDGLSTETDWAAEGEAEPLWSLEVGLGYSSVSIQDGRLYTMGYDEMAGLDLVWCLDAETGEELWVHTYPAEIWNQMHGGGTLTTPSIDGDVVYTLNREGNLFCLDAENGEVLWQKQLAQEFDLEPPTWGFGASPLVLDDMLIVNVGKVLALAKDDGDVLWTSKQYGHAYSTPCDFELEGRPALAVFNSAGLAVIDRTDGDERYFHEWKTQYDINAATPIVVDGKIFVSSGLNHGCTLLAPGEDGLEVVWENKEMRNKMSGCVLMDGHLYGFDESVLKCIDLSGQEKWNVRGVGNGALMGAPGRLIVVSSKGELIVAEASPEAFRELSRTKVLESNGVFWTKPVLLDGLIYCRSSMGQLVCRDHRARAGE